MKDREERALTDLSGLHLLCAFAEGEVGVAGRGAVSALMLHCGDESAAESEPLRQPVVVDGDHKVLLVLQQTLRFSHTQNLHRVRRW